MMKKVALLTSLSLVSAEQPSNILEKFEEFKAHWKKQYNKTEELKRLKAFVHNMYEIEMAAAKNPKAKFSHLSVNADKTQEELKQLKGFIPSLSKNVGPKAKKPELLSTKDIPSAIDWRSKGAVNDVKDQAQCGSCWAFATVANVEGQNFVKTGKLLSLSEQELVDCSGSDDGCNGGLPERAYEDMIDRHMGLEAEDDYSYHASDGRCKAKKNKELVWINDWTPVSTDEDQIAAALVKYGPLAIGINANYFNFYSGGILDMDSSECDPQMLDHGVAIIGYGEEEGSPYWIVRNSWGAGWGEDGYIRIARGKGTCGINTMVTSAIINSSAQEPELLEI